MGIPVDLHRLPPIVRQVNSPSSLPIAMESEYKMPHVEKRYPDYTGCKVFSTTKFREREMMGETITRWISAHPELEIVDRQVLQSSDREFHCLTIILFYQD